MGNILSSAFTVFYLFNPIKNRDNVMHSKVLKTLAKNSKFTRKADIYYRLSRLVDNKYMGELFKVMFVTKKNNKFRLGF